MRDIREDLQDRATFLKGQIDAAQAQFEKSVDRIKREHDSTLQGLKANLDAVNRLMGAEQRRHADTPSVSKVQAQPQPQPPQPQAQQPNMQPPQPPKARPRMPLAEMIGLQRAS